MANAEKARELLKQQDFYERFSILCDELARQERHKLWERNCSKCHGLASK